MNVSTKTSKKTLFSCGVGLLLAAGGCAVDHGKEVAQYRNVLDTPHLPPATQVTQTDPLSLSQAMALANQNNENLGLSGEDYVQALIDKNRAVASFLPTVEFQPSYTIADRVGTPLASSQLRAHGSVVRGWSAPVVGGINLFNGLGDVATLKAAEAVIAQRRELLQDLQATILLNVAQAYYQILRSEKSVEVLRNSLQLQETRLQDVEQQFKNGLATQLSVSQTRAKLADTRVQLIQAQSDVRNGRFTLAQVIGVGRVDNVLTDSFNVPDAPGDEASYEALAFRYRNDLVAAGQALVVARQSVDVAVAQYYPSVTLNVEGLLGSTAYSDASKWNAVLSANLPIFSAGRIRADVRTAWSRVRQAALNESAVRRQALHDVQTAYENLLTAGRRIRELQAEVQAADEAYTQARGAFLNGLGINLDVLTAQDLLLNAQLQLTGAEFDRTVFYLDLLRATGQLPNPSGLPTTAPSTTVVMQ